MFRVSLGLLFVAARARGKPEVPFLNVLRVRRGTGTYYTYVSGLSSTEGVIRVWYSYHSPYEYVVLCTYTVVVVAKYVTWYNTIVDVCFRRQTRDKRQKTFPLDKEETGIIRTYVHACVRIGDAGSRRSGVPSVHDIHIVTDLPSFPCLSSRRAMDLTIRYAS